MTIASASVSSVASTLLNTSSVSAGNSEASLDKQKQTLQTEIKQENQSKDSATAKAQKLQDYDQELQKVDLELQQLYKSSSAVTAAIKPKGPTSGLLNESA